MLSESDGIKSESLASRTTGWRVAVRSLRAAKIGIRIFLGQSYRRGTMGKSEEREVDKAPNANGRGADARAFVAGRV